MTDRSPTVFALLCERCGLSADEAARYLEADPAAVAAWSSGAQACSDNIVAQLRLLYRQISVMAEQAMRQFVTFSQGQGSPAEVEISLAPDDAAAQRLGLPCMGAHRAVLGMVIARAHGTRFVLVGEGVQLPVR
ncbi:MAG TPA: hypothetical protein VND94_23090 [Terriglobia bacterium]|nr:hypothetical protein [Terriglobia bacterium]